MTDNIELRLNPKDVERITKKFGNVAPMLEDEMRRTMRASLDLAEGTIRSVAPVNTGNFRGSISNQMRGTRGTIRGKVFSPLKHGIVIERGRKPGSKQPPTHAIELWAKQVGIGAAGEDIRGIAFVIARAIGRRGIKGRFPFRRGFNQARPRILAMWTRMNHRIVNRLGKP